MSLTFRYAKKTDTALIVQFIKELAEYEKIPDQGMLTEELLEEWIFIKKQAEVIFAVENETEVGFAIFLLNLPTFLGRPGIYIEDLFVKPEFRGLGYGKSLMQELARIAIEHNCSRLEWWCRDWNKPGIDFYLSLGAEPMSDWTVYRIAGDTLTKLADR